MRRIAILFVPFLLAGCAAALPPQLALVSQAADGVAYVFTGKSGTDHLVSAAFRRDCAVIRMVQGEAICKARREDTELGQAEIQIYGGHPGAALDAPAAGDQTVALASVAPGPPPAARTAADDAAPVPPTSPVALLPSGPARPASVPDAPTRRDTRADRVPEPAPKAKPAPQARHTDSYYVVVGEYRNWSRALDRAGRQIVGIAAIVSRRDGGGKRHRVMLGPYRLAAARETRGKLAAGDAKVAWLVKACPIGASRSAPGGCMDLAKTWR
ncbi:MAG: hypothetical protein OEO83_05660 [Alphaproteobacteria bacterium]|nr:hypothetical protein [Alphaproteobacteria bacterium]